jgi:hypothetical protein
MMAIGGRKMSSLMILIVGTGVYMTFGMFGEQGWLAVLVSGICGGVASIVYDRRK